MNRRIATASAVLLLSSFCLFAQKHYTDTKIFVADTPLSDFGFVVPGNMTYGFYKGPSGETVMDGAFKFTGSQKGKLNGVSYSATYNVTGGYKDGLLNGTFSAKGHDSTKYRGETWTADYGATITFVKGVPEGSISAWLTDSSLPSKCSVSATVKKGKLVGSFSCKPKGISDDVTGQFTADGVLTGEWRFKDYSGEVSIFNFKNNVLVGGGYITWTDDMYRLAKEYASGKISKDKLIEMGYEVKTKELNLGGLASFVRGAYFLSLDEYHFGETDFSCCWPEYEYLEQKSMINEFGLAVLTQMFQSHIRSGMNGRTVSGISYGNNTDSIALSIPGNDKYMKLNVLPYNYRYTEILDGAEPSFEKALISKADYEAMTAAIEAAARECAYHYYDLLNEPAASLAKAGNFEKMVADFGADASLKKVREALEKACRGSLTEDGKYYRIPDSYLMMENPSGVNLDYLEKALADETEYETLRGKVKANISGKRSDKSLKQNAFKSMAAVFHGKVDAKSKPELNVSMSNALKVLDGGQVFSAIASENQRIKSECSSKLAASVSACTGSLLGDGRFSDVKSCNEYMDRVIEAGELQKDAVRFFTLSNEAQAAKAGVVEKYGKVYKAETKTFASEFDSSLPGVDFTSHKEILDRIEKCNELKASADNFVNTCSVADTMNAEYNTLMETVKANKKAAKQFGAELKSLDLKPAFGTVEDMQKKAESYRALAARIVAAGA